MNKALVVTAIAASGLLLGGMAMAGGAALAAPTSEEIYQLMDDRGYRCLECHDVERKVVGPAWKEVAAKRYSHKWARAVITHKISAGSIGEYGTEPMPHNHNLVSDGDADLIATWIMALWEPAPELASKAPCQEP